MPAQTVRVPARIEDQLKALPDQPGVYIFRDAAGAPLYVGKAAVLKNRVRSYFSSPLGHTSKTRSLARHVSSIDFIVTDSPVEALVLECNLIKQYRPKFNVMLRDDKNFPYIRISLDEEYPRVYRTRNFRKDAGRYFGPFTSSKSLDETMRLLKKIFPYRSCHLTITGETIAAREKKPPSARTRPCLEYYIGRCLGPCVGATSQDEYRKTIDQVILFMEGRQEAVVEDMRRKMLQASDELRFEQAAFLRDRIHAVERVIERQKMVSIGVPDQDVVGLARAAGDACAQIFFIRGAKLIGRDHYILQGAEGEEDSAVLESFLKQFYDTASSLPGEILVPVQPEDAEAIEAWLGARRGRRVQVRVPQRGERRKLLLMATENARQLLEQEKIRRLSDEEKTQSALSELAEALNLDNMPLRIECYDISHIQGTSTVASMVVFENGRPRTSHYRKFRMKSVLRNDDFACMKEVLSRRFARAGSGDAGESWSHQPDLIIIDGGKGQLNAALEILEEFGLSGIPTVGLAKELELIFVPGREQPLALPHTSQAFYLVQRIRDEAHRFAITYHRQLRGKSTISSGLDEIQGIGPKRRKALLRHFGSVKRIREVSLEEVATVPGFTLKLAEAVKAHLGQAPTVPA